MDNEIRLPDLLCDCIDVGLRDLELCEQEPEKYAVRTCVWHVPVGYTKKCNIGFTGSIIAKTFKISPNQICGPDNFEEHNCARLKALDLIESGKLSTAISRFYNGKKTIVNIPVPQYHTEPADYKTALQKISTLLREMNL